MCGSSCRRQSRMRQAQVQALAAQPSSPPLSEKDKVRQQYSMGEKTSLMQQSKKEVESAPPTYATAMESSSPIDVQPVKDQSAVLGPHNAECAATGHKVKRHYGAVGLIGGIVFFPWGLFWTACDSSASCTRCGAIFKQKHAKGDKCRTCRKYGCQGRCGAIATKA